jgi:hypothetical protein
LHPHNPSEGHVATIHVIDESSHHEHINPHAYENVSFLSTKQSTTHRNTPQRKYVGASSTARCTEDHAEQGQGAYASKSSIDISQEEFPGYSCVISTGIVQTTFLVDENHVPIKIEKIPGIAKVF